MLDPKTALLLCRRYFPDVRGWDEPKVLNSLQGLTPGDIAVVGRRSQTIGETYESAEAVITALATERRYKNTQPDDIGFCP